MTATTVDRLRRATAARASTASGMGFLILLVALHALKSELDPSWHFISEYAIGTYGWVMRVAFLLLATAYTTLFIALRPHVGRFAGNAGLALLLVSAVGLAIAALFVADSITATSAEATTHGRIHEVGGALGVGMPLAAALLTWRLRKPAGLPGRRAIAWTGSLAVCSSIAAAVSVAAMVAGNDGDFGPGADVGWPNRLDVVANTVWVVVASRFALQLNRSAHRVTTARGVGRRGSLFVVVDEGPDVP